MSKIPCVLVLTNDLPVDIKITNEKVGSTQRHIFSFSWKNTILEENSCLHGYFVLFLRTSLIKIARFQMRERDSRQDTLLGLSLKYITYSWNVEWLLLKRHNLINSKVDVVGVVKLTPSWKYDNSSDTPYINTSLAAFLVILASRCYVLFSKR